MNYSKSFYLSFILILIFSTILAIAGVKGFLRLAPSIDKINNHNTQSLYVAEKMMSALTVKKDIHLFEIALNEGKQNITETGEAEAIKKIENSYKKAFTKNSAKTEETANNIIALSSVNRIAMKNAAIKAQKNSSTGAWAIALCGLITWILGLLLMKALSTNIIKPLKELSDVLMEYSKGNQLRRCPKLAPNQDFQKIYDSINKLLDSQK